MFKAFVSWSGGKETALSFYEATQNHGINVSYLLNMVSENGERSRGHGISADLIKLQADLIGVPVVQKKTTWPTYEEVFKKAISELKKEGVKIGIFGDIDLGGHLDWVKRICREMSINPIEPLWQRKREDLLNNFIDSGFEAVVVTTKADILGPEWLGRKIDKNFIKDLKIFEKIDLCGEMGEYHTLVTNGPIFKKPIKIKNVEKIEKDGCWYLDINATA